MTETHEKPTPGESRSTSPAAGFAPRWGGALEPAGPDALEVVEFVVRYEEELACLAGEGVLTAHRTPQSLR